MRYSALLIALMFISCAFLITKDSQDVSVNSQPIGAKLVVKTTGGVPVFEGETPASIRLKRKNTYVVTVSMEGYKEQSIQIDKTINPYILGNFLCGGIPGLVVDGITGAMWNLEPEQIIITLQVGSIDGKENQLFVLITWLNENQEMANIPIILTSK